MLLVQIIKIWKFTFWTFVFCLFEFVQYWVCFYRNSWLLRPIPDRLRHATADCWENWRAKNSWLVQLCRLWRAGSSRKFRKKILCNTDKYQFWHEWVNPWTVKYSNEKISASTLWRTQCKHHLCIIHDFLLWKTFICNINQKMSCVFSVLNLAIGFEISCT